jgi:protein tyrosine phosphatase (PTP) superfamily phosphohydrolase (DUF442 family)
MEKYTEEEFDEQKLVEELGMTYLHFPMGGKAGYTPQVVDTLALTLEEHTGKALIHCLSAGRVGYLWVAYLVNHRGMTIDDAIYLGRHIKFSSALEKLLGYEVSIRRKE